MRGHQSVLVDTPDGLVVIGGDVAFDRHQVWIVHRGVEVACYERCYEQGVWLPPPIMHAEPPASPPPVVLPRITVAPPELADYAELCA